VYILSAACLGLSLAFLVAFSAFSGFADGVHQSTRTANTVFAALLFLAIMGTSILNVAMWYFWVCCHSNDSRSKGVWLLVLWGLSPIGALFYFLFFYLRSSIVRAPLKEQATAA